MLNQGTGFAQYSKTLCWIVSFILLAIALLSFFSEAPNATVLGMLWLAGAFAFAISALFLSKSSQTEDGSAGQAGE